MRVEQEYFKRANMKRRALGVTAVMLILSVTGMARFGVPQQSVPIDRLLANTKAYIEEHPGVAMGPYTLARIHYLALATRDARIAAHEFSPPEVFPPRNVPSGRPGDYFRQIALPPTGAGPGAWTEAQLRGHLTAAVENYQKALRMDATNALFHLGLASVSEAALVAGFKLGPIPGARPEAPPANGDFTPLWREHAIAEYLRAYELSVTVDTALRNLPTRGINTLISYEAGQHYTEMVKARGVRAAEKRTLSQMLATRGTLARKPQVITPIIFQLGEAAPKELAALLDPRRTVEFDLDGTTRAQRYNWVRPDTAILVWDPTGTGRITSGHQLFGSVSFNMFWSDGYRALDALDDNRDGVISGAELIGLAV